MRLLNANVPAETTERLTCVLNVTGPDQLDTLLLEMDPPDRDPPLTVNVSLPTSTPDNRRLALTMTTPPAGLPKAVSVRAWTCTSLTVVGPL